MSAETCRYCGRGIEQRDGGWASPDADHSDDDPYNCEDHDTFEADHEPIGPHDPIEGGVGR